MAILARDSLNISGNNLSTETDLPRDSSEGEIIPWLCRQANSISTSCLVSSQHSVSKKKPSRTTIAPHLPSVEWFYHGDLPLGTDSKNARKMDFGLLWRDYEYTNCGSDRVYWEDVEVVGEHTDQQHSLTKKTVKLAEYARHALLHQPDRRFIFGFLVYGFDLYLYLFTSVGVISSEPFNLLQNPVTLRILIRGITHLPAEKRGRDINFRRVHNPRQPDRYRRFLDFKIALTQTKRVEDRGAQGFIETAAEDAGVEDAGAGHAVAREKYPEGRDCEFLDAEVALLGPLYRSSALFGRRTNVWLAEIHEDTEALGNNKSPTHIVIKIVSRDMDATLSEREILNKATEYGNIDMPLLVPHIEFTLRGHPDITRHMILQNWQPAVDVLGTSRKREITMSKSVGVPLSMVRPPPLRLLKVARDIIVTLERLHTAGILHRDVSINNIMCTLKKGEHIVLESGERITAKSSTLLAGEKDSGLEAFLNDYDLATYAAEASGMKTLTGTWAFIAPSRLQNWGVHHAHQDVVSVMLCVIWMACVEPIERNLEENKPEPLTSPPVSNSQHKYTLRTRPIPKSINHERANSRTTTFGSSGPRKTIPPLDRKHPHIAFCSDIALELKSYMLAHPHAIMKFFTGPFQIPVFMEFIDDMAIAISTAPETSYHPDRAMENQLAIGDGEAHKAYVKLMDQRFPGLVRELIKIIDGALEKLTA